MLNYYHKDSNYIIIWVLDPLYIIIWKVIIFPEVVGFTYCFLFGVPVALPSSYGRGLKSCWLSPWLADYLARPFAKQVLDFLLRFPTILGVMPFVFMVPTTHVVVPLLGWSSHGWGSMKEVFVLDLHQDLKSRSSQRSVVVKIVGKTIWS